MAGTARGRPLPMSAAPRLTPSAWPRARKKIRRSRGRRRTAGRSPHPSPAAADPHSADYASLGRGRRSMLAHTRTGCPLDRHLDTRVIPVVPWGNRLSAAHPARPERVVSGTGRRRRIASARSGADTRRRPITAPSVDSGRVARRHDRAGPACLKERVLSTLRSSKRSTIGVERPVPSRWDGAARARVTELWPLTFTMELEAR